jgi:hypothetical protein
MTRIGPFDVIVSDTVPEDSLLLLAPRREDQKRQLAYMPEGSPPRGSWGRAGAPGHYWIPPLEGYPQDNQVVVGYFPGKESGS